MFLNIEKIGKHQLKDLYSSGKVFQHILDQGILAETEDKPWDGFIHPSYLNWNREAKKQFEDMVKKGSFRKPVEAHRRFRLGNLIHDDIQTIIEEHFPGECFREVRFSREDIMFHGTADFFCIHPKLGPIVAEFKSYSELKRDATFANRMMEKFERLLQDKGFEREAQKKNPLLNRYTCFTNKEIDELFHRLHTREEILTEPDTGHLTQVCTYAWMAKRYREGLVQVFDKHGRPKYDKDGDEIWEPIELPAPKRVVVCYVGKSKYETTEFWYSLKKHSDLLEKAKENYKAVLKQLRRYERKYA